MTDERRFAPYCVHPLAQLDFAKQIPRTSDQRQMERWQRIGVYAAGLALEDANLAGNAELLDRTNLCIAAGNGERDLALDARVLEAIDSAAAPGATLNRELMTGLRPTLYLGQLSNLLAGNISIIHGATGSSRTFKGEEMAGVAAIANAVDRIEAGQGELFLVGGALNAEREDLLLNCELAARLYAGPFRSVWARSAQDGGLILGSLGVFMVIEAASHACARGIEPYARIASVRSDRSRRETGHAASLAARLFETLGIAPTGGKLAVLSGASGAEPITADELEFLDGMKEAGFHPLVRAWGSILGHSLEAHFIAGMALAAMSVCEGSFYPPFDQSGRELTGQARTDGVLVTAFGHWRGEALGFVTPVQ